MDANVFSCLPTTHDSSEPCQHFYPYAEKDVKVHGVLITFAYIQLLNFLTGLLIVLALDHLSYLLDSYLCSDWLSCTVIQYK